MTGGRYDTETDLNSETDEQSSSSEYDAEKLSQLNQNHLDSLKRFEQSKYHYLPSEEDPGSDEEDDFS